jgi:hypothetical protein
VGQYKALPDTEAGLGPRFNLDSCAGCHSQPDIGGSSPAVNPQNRLSPGNQRNVFHYRRPIREARFKFYPNGLPDGGVQALQITGARCTGCVLRQPDFHRRGNAGRSSNTDSTFGVGEHEAIDATRS